MYKYLIIGIAFIFTLSGNYYIRKAGGAELISKAISGETKTNSIPLPIGDMVGLYICDTLSGCKNKHILLLKSDQTSELLQISDDVDITKEELSEINTEVEQETVKNQDDITLGVSISTSAENNEGILNSDIQNYNNSGGIATNTIINNELPNSEEDVNFDENNSISSQLLSTFELGNDSMFTIEKGTWDLDMQNILVINIKERGTSTYQVPQKIVIKNIDESGTFSKISYTKSNYENMVNPTFIKQQ